MKIKLKSTEVRKYRYDKSVYIVVVVVDATIA